jgi:hypothetical protein
MTSPNFPETCHVYSLPFPACWAADNRAKQSLPYLLALRIVWTNHRKTQLQPPRKDRYRKPDDKRGTETWKQVHCYVILPVQFFNECRCTCSCLWKSPTEQKNLLEVPAVRLSSAADIRLTWRDYGLLWRNHRPGIYLPSSTASYPRRQWYSFINFIVL